MDQQKIKEWFDKRTADYKTWSDCKHSKVNLGIIKSLNPNTRVLSLGCGSGREVKALVERGCEVVAVDFSEYMVFESKKVEPKANYFCVDVCTLKSAPMFDYIIGLFSLLNYIPKDKRRQLIENCWDMLKENGTAIFEVRFVSEDPKQVVRSLLPENKGLFHVYSKAEMKWLLRGLDYEIKESIVIIKKGEKK